MIYWPRRTNRKGEPNAERVERIVGAQGRAMKLRVRDGFYVAMCWLIAVALWVVELNWGLPK